MRLRTIAGKVLRWLRAKHGRRVARLAYLRWLVDPHGLYPTPDMRSFAPTLRGRLLTLPLVLPRRVYAPPRPATKVAAILRYARDHDLRYFVETGTHVGNTVAAVSPHFKQCWTIELSTVLFGRAFQRLVSVQNVTCSQGSSTGLLPGIVRRLPGPALFWLDAHYSGGETAGEGNNPLVEDLKIILADPRDHVVLIDDARGCDVKNIFYLAAGRCVLVRNDIIRITARAQVGDPEWALWYRLMQHDLEVA